MGRSLKTSVNGSKLAKAALVRYGFSSQTAFAENLAISRSTVSNFFNCKPVDRIIFEEICHRLDLKWQQVSNQTVYIERGIEDQVIQAIKKDGALVRIVGLKQSGKTSLLEQIIIPQAQLEDYATISLSFNRVNDSFLQDIEKLYQWFCHAINQELRLKLNLETYWDKYATPNDNVSNYLERILDKLNGKNLLLALDDFDNVFDNMKVADDFCKLLRFWHDEPNRNNKDSQLWRQLRLVILHSTEKYAELDINSSPLANVGQDFGLDEFNEHQAKEFIKQYDLNWSDNDLNSLMGLVGGHPYLIDKACQESEQKKVEINQLIKEAYTDVGIYEHHLREKLTILQNQPELRECFKKVLDSGMKGVKFTDINNSTGTFQLERLGLIQLESKDNSVIIKPRCQLYIDYFKAQFSTKEDTP